MIVQFASTSTYSHPICAARSTNCFCFVALLGLGLSAHRLLATRPGLIQVVSATLDAGLTSVTKVDSTMVPSEPRIMTRHGVTQGNSAEDFSEYTPLPSLGLGNAMW